MKNEATKEIVQHGIDLIADMIEHDQRIDATELHHHLYNEDYFIIGTYQAKEFLNKYGTFEAIEKVKEYEEDNFGEVTTDFSDPEKVVNMLAYVEGEEALNSCGTLQHEWDNGELSEDDLIAIKAELGGQL